MKEVELFPDLLVAKLDHNVLLSVTLAAVVIPITHTLLHRYLIAVCPYVFYEVPSTCQDSFALRSFRSLQPLGYVWCNAQPDKKKGGWDPTRHHNELKFQQSCWKAFVYTVLSIGSSYALSKETFWRRNTAELWTDCAQRLPCAYQASPEMNFAYSLEAAYIMYAIPYATFIDIRRKDYWATMSHHWVTLLLITFSYAMGFNKVGLVIMLLHDVADPFLELAKLGNYVSPPQKGFTNAFFGIFTFLWISMRVVYFPLWVIYSVLFNAVEEVAGDADPTRFMWVWYGFSSLLILLFLLHLFWTYTILKIALLAVSNGSGAKDSREDDTEGRLTSR